jgi:hypothetical protein
MSIAVAGVLALSLLGFRPRGYWVFRPCPRAYLHAPAHSKQGPFPPAASHRFRRYYEPLGLPPSSPRFRSPPYTRGLCPTWAAREGLSCSPPFLHNVPPPLPRGRPTSTSDSVRCLLPSPWHDRLGHPKHLSADNLTRLARRPLALRPAVLLPPRRLLSVRSVDTITGADWTLLPGASALTRAELSSAGTMRLSRRTMRRIIAAHTLRNKRKMTILAT